MEGMLDSVLFLIGLKVLLLGQKSKEKTMGKGKRGKRGKRNRWQEEADDQLTVKNLISEEKPKKPFENIKLLPPRDAQSKPE